jgi:hypothetical protein
MLTGAAVDSQNDLRCNIRHSISMALRNVFAEETLGHMRCGPVRRYRRAKPRRGSGPSNMIARPNRKETVLALMER